MKTKILTPAEAREHFKEARFTHVCTVAFDPPLRYVNGKRELSQTPAPTRRATPPNNCSAPDSPSHS